MSPRAATSTPKPPLAERMAEKRRCILAAALGLFAKRGFDGTPVPEVAKEAGVAAGTIYRYFASKEELVNVLFRQWKGAFRDALVEGYPAAAPIRQQFAHLWQGMRRFTETQPVAFMFLETHFHGPYLDEESLALEDQVMSIGRDFVVQGIEQGVFKPLPPELLVTIVFGAFTALVKQAAEGRCPIDTHSFQQAEEVCWDAITLKETS